MQVNYVDGRTFCGWWQHGDGIVRTVVAAPPANPPIRLHFTKYVPDAVSLCA
jgi:hypothetical protein